MPAKNNILSPGTILNHDGRDLRIIKRLNSGLTGEVYEGELTLENNAQAHVAVKVMKTLDFPQARQFFMEESERLAVMRYLEEKANAEQGISLRVAPEYYGRGEVDKDYPYLVMEFINGKEIPAILGDKGKFDEREALLVGWHLYRTLDILHTERKETYIDLKFENLWWCETPQQLKLTDFGTMEKIRPGDQWGIRRDLLLGGVFLFKLLTGYTLLYSLGELKEPAAPKIAECADSLSWGTVQLLRRILHRNTGRRPANASEIALALRSLVRFWDESPEKLRAIAENNLAEAEQLAEDARENDEPISADAREYAEHAYAAFDILHNKHGQDVSAEIDRVRAVLKLGGYLERGIALLKGFSFQVAFQTFAEGMDWSDNPAELRRWKYIAAAGQEAPAGFNDELIDKVEKAIQSLNIGAFAMFLEQHLPRLSDIQSPGLGWLQAEAAFFDLLKQGDAAKAQDDFAQAVQHYRAAQEELKKLQPEDQKFILEQEVGDLAVEITRLNDLAQNEQAALALYAQAESATRFRERAELAEKAYLDYRQVRFRFEKLTALARKTLEQSLESEEGSLAERLDYAARIASLLGMEVLPDESSRQVCLTVLALRNAQRSASQRLLGPLDENVAEAVKHGGGLPVKQVLDKIIKEALIQPVARGEEAFFGRLAEFAEKILTDSETAARLREQAADSARKGTEARHEKIDRLFDRLAESVAPFLAKPEELLAYLQNTARAATQVELSAVDILKRSEHALLRAEKILLEIEEISRLDDYRLSDVDETRQFLQKTRELAQQDAQHHQMQANERKQMLAALTSERQKLDALRRWWERGQELGAVSLTESAFGETMQQGWIAFQKQCFDALATPGMSQQEEALVSDYIAQASDALDGLHDAHAGIFAESEKHQKALLEAQAILRHDFEEGCLEAAARAIHALPRGARNNPQTRDLLAKMQQAKLWQDWCLAHDSDFKSGSFNPNLLKGLRDYLSLGLPVIYWTNSPAPAYLTAAWQDSQAQLQVASDAGLVDGIKQALQISWTGRLAQGQQPAEGLWDGRVWLERAQTAVRVQGRTALNEQIKLTPIPQNFETALASFNAQDWRPAPVAPTLPEPQTDPYRRRGPQSFLPDMPLWQKLTLGGMSLMLCVTLGIFAGILLINRPVAPTPEATPVEVIAPIETPVPTSIPPTAIPIPTEIPTEIPTPVPDSKYFLPAERAQANILPPQPISGEVWLIPPSDSQPSSPFSDATVWTASNKAGDALEPADFYYTEKAVSVTWEMDEIGLPAGLYTIYVPDREFFSSGSFPYTIFVNDVQQFQTSARFLAAEKRKLTSSDQKPYPVWLTLGLVSLEQDGQKLKVVATAQDSSDKDDIYFAADELLIIKLGETEAEIAAQLLAKIDETTPGGKIVALRDNAGLYKIENSVHNAIPVTDPADFTQFGIAWGGSWNKVNLGKLAERDIQWWPQETTPPGTYELWAWIPWINENQKLNYRLLDGNTNPINGNPINSDTAGRTPELTGLTAGAWVNVGEWTIDKEIDIIVQLRVDTAQLVGVDVIALVKKP